jgi:HEAT repeat protein
MTDSSPVEPTSLGVPPSLTEKSALRQREIESHLSTLHSPAAGARAAAARRLGDLQAGLDALLDALNDPHESVRSAAALALGSFYGSEQSGEIVESLLAAIDDPSEKVCQAAIRSLGTLKAEIARPEIEEFLDDANPFIAGAAILSLARLGACDQAERLASFLERDNYYVKIQSVRAIGLLKYAPAGPEVLQLLQVTRQQRLVSGQDELKSRLDWREDELYGLQNQLIRTAGELRLVEAVPTLIDIAQKDVGLRGLAVEALIAIGAEIDPNLLTNLLTDPSIYLRKRLIALMTQHSYRQALPLIRPLLRVDNASTRSAALQAITQMNDYSATAEVVWMCFHDSNPFVRVQAVQSLVSLTGTGAAPHLLSLSGDANYQVRRAAVTQLVEWAAGDPSSLSALARYAMEFPEDDFTPSITKILKDHGFDPATLVTETAGKQSLVPPEMLDEAQNLLVLLDRWRMALRQQNEALAESEIKSAEAALSHLISILADARQQQK